jgi:hypothetical protein
MGWLSKWKVTRNLVKKELSAKETIGTYDILTELLNTVFVNVELANQVKRDVIILIISNRFMVKPVHLISYFKNEYDFNLDEFVILSFKLGMLSKIYIDNPIILLEDAIKLNDVFSKEDIEYFEEMLKHRKANKEKAFEQQVAMFQENLERKNAERKLKSKNDEADELIDEWLRKNKKK